MRTILATLRNWLRPTTTATAVQLALTPAQPTLTDLYAICRMQSLAQRLGE